MFEKKRDQKLVDKLGEDAEKCAAQIGKLTRQQRVIKQDLDDCEAALAAKKLDATEIDERLQAALRGEPLEMDTVAAEPQPVVRGEPADDVGAQPQETENVDTGNGSAFDSFRRPESRETRGEIFDTEKHAEETRGDVSGF